MKNILFLLLPALLAAATLSAQTPEEIIARVDQETARFDAEGCSMVMELKFPIIGAVATTIYTRGDKYKMIMSIKGDSSISWSDGVTDWDYESSKNTVTIKPHKADGS
jgi:outer membrane lipoprotein-sorting protein